MPNIKIELDGSEKGTKLTINGMEIPAIKSVSFSHYGMNQDSLFADGPYFQYTVIGESGGFKNETTYFLSQAGLIEAKIEKPGALNYKKKNGKEKNIYAHPGKEAPELTEKKKSSAMIKKMGNQYCVFSSDGKKKIACHSTRQDAVKQLQAIEISKHKKGK